MGPLRDAPEPKPSAEPAEVLPAIVVTTPVDITILRIELLEK